MRDSARDLLLPPQASTSYSVTPISRPASARPSSASVTPMPRPASARPSSARRDIRPPAQRAPGSAQRKQYLHPVFHPVLPGGSLLPGWLSLTLDLLPSMTRNRTYPPAPGGPGRPAGGGSLRGGRPPVWRREPSRTGQ
eukprot:1194303-Prorocentrum_minimum.AAC.7